VREPDFVLLANPAGQGVVKKKQARQLDLLEEDLFRLQSVYPLFWDTRFP
jgi:hypothetical protein